MRGHSVESLLSELLREVGGPQRPSYLILRGDPAPIVLVFDSGAETPLFVFKAARDGDLLDSLIAEHRTLSDLHSAAPASFRKTIPLPVLFKEVRGLAGSLTTVLPGARLKDLAPRGVFGPATVATTLGRVNRWLAGYHKVTRTLFPHSQPTDRRELFEDPAENYLKWFRVSVDERALIRESVQGLPDPGTAGLPLCRGHGDFSPANVLWDDGRIGVIDFEYALDPCLPLEDLFHFLASMQSTTSAHDREAARRRFFEESFYASGYLSRASRRAVHDLARKLGIDFELIEKLFVLAWVRYAVRSVELQIRRLDLGALREDPDRLWEHLDAQPEEFLPVARIGGGICENVRQHVEQRDRFRPV